MTHRSEALDVPLVTLDVRLAGAPGARARVEVLPTGDQRPVLWIVAHYLRGA